MIFLKKPECYKFQLIADFSNSKKKNLFGEMKALMDTVIKTVTHIHSSDLQEQEARYSEPEG